MCAQMQCHDSKALRTEDVHNAMDVVRKLRESWDNRIDFPPTEILKRYLGRDLKIRIEGSLLFRDAFLGNMGVTLEHDIQFGPSCRPHIETVENYHKLSMLVDPIHVMNNPQWVIQRPSEDSFLSPVRLERLNDIPSDGRDPLYLSLVLLQFRFVGGLDRKNGKSDLLSAGSLRPCIGTGEFPCDMIQATPEMMNNLATQNTEASGDYPSSKELYRFIRNSRVVVFDSGVVPIFEKSSNFSFEVSDILVGPV